MTKKEYKKESRYWRMLNKSAFPHADIKRKEDIEAVREFLFTCIYNVCPEWYWKNRPRNIYVREIKDKFDIRLNIRCAPNSYPHSTKNQ